MISQHSVITASDVKLIRKTISNSSTLFVSDLELQRIRLEKFVSAIRVVGSSTGGGFSELFEASLL